MAFAISSVSFPQDGDIPRKFTCDGADTSPEFTWSTPVPLSASGEGLAAGSISVASGGGETTAVWASDGVVRARTLSAAGETSPLFF